MQDCVDAANVCGGSSGKESRGRRKWQSKGVCVCVCVKRGKLEAEGDWQTKVEEGREE